MCLCVCVLVCSSVTTAQRERRANQFALPSLPARSLQSSHAIVVPLTRRFVGRLRCLRYILLSRRGLFKDFGSDSGSAFGLSSVPFPLPIISSFSLSPSPNTHSYRFPLYVADICYMVSLSHRLCVCICMSPQLRYRLTSPSSTAYTLNTKTALRYTFTRTHDRWQLDEEKRVSICCLQFGFHYRICSIFGQNGK